MMLEHKRKGYDLQGLLFHAQKLADQLVNNPAVSAVAGYQLKSDARVFYPADFRPTDMNNFATLIYVNGDEAEPGQPHYVLRYLDRVGGSPGNAHALVSVANWNAGMSRAVADRVCNDAGQPLIVYPRPIIAEKAPGEGVAPCS